MMQDLVRLIYNDVLELIKDGCATGFRYSNEILRFRTPNVVAIFIQCRSRVNYQRIDRKYSTSTNMDLVLKKNDYGSKDILERVIVNQETE